MTMKNTWKIALSLTVFCVIAAFSLAVVNSVTQKEIERRSQEDLKKALQKVAPFAQEFQKWETVPPVQTPTKDFSILEVYEALKEGKREGLVFRVSTTGYGGPIILLVGISEEGKLTGMEVLEHQETPGLGSNIESDSFLSQFLDKPLTDPFEVNKDIKAISGATISTRAIVRACQGLASYWEEIGKP